MFLTSAKFKNTRENIKNSNRNKNSLEDKNLNLVSCITLFKSMEKIFGFKELKKNKLKRSSNKKLNS